MKARAYIQRWATAVVVLVLWALLVHALEQST